MRTIKIVGIGVAGLVALLIALLLVVALLVNPNAYKGRIERAVKTSTGRDLMLAGDLKLSVFPWFALRFGPATLGNPPGFGPMPFVTLREASLRVRLLPLLHGDLQVGRVEVDGLDMQLQRNAQGQGNWEGLTGNNSGATPAAAPASSSAPSGIPEVAGIAIRGSQISYDTWTVNDLNVDVGRVAPGVPIPVSVRLQLQGASAGRPIPLAGQFQLTDDAQGLQLSGLDLHLDDSRVQGRAAVPQAPTAPMSFDLAIDQLDLARYLSPTPPALAATPAASLPSTPTALPTGMLKTLQMTGMLSIGTLRVDGMTVSQVHLQAVARGGHVQLAPITATLYGGTYRGDVSVDASGATPVVKLDQTLSGVNVALLLKDFAGTQRFSGSGDLSSDLTGQGADTGALRRSLDGHATLNLANGAIEGIDLPFEVEQAVALVQRRAPPAGHGSGRTNFNTFRASADVHDAVATTKDLDIATQLVRAQGQGTLNLLTDAVNYQVQVTLLKPPAGTGASAATFAAIPLDVTGTLASLQVRPDLQQLARTQLRQQLQPSGALRQKVESALKGLFQRGSKPR